MNKVSGLLVLASLSRSLWPLAVRTWAPSSQAEVTTKVAALTGTVTADFEDRTTDELDTPRGRVMVIADRR